MYLPTEDPEERAQITAAFEQYRAKEEALLGEKYGIRVHWAKVELPEGEEVGPDNGYIMLVLATLCVIHHFVAADPRVFL